MQTIRLDLRSSDQRNVKGGVIKHLFHIQPTCDQDSDIWLLNFQQTTAFIWFLFDFQQLLQPWDAYLNVWHLTNFCNHMIVFNCLIRSKISSSHCERKNGGRGNPQEWAACVLQWMSISRRVVLGLLAVWMVVVTKEIHCDKHFTWD